MSTSPIGVWGTVLRAAAIEGCVDGGSGALGADDIGGSGWIFGMAAIGGGGEICGGAIIGGGGILRTGAAM